MSTEARSIAHVLTSLNVGGAERMALLLASSQLRRGHRVCVVSLEEPPNGPLLREFEEAGIVVRRVVKRPGGFDATLFARLLACFRELRLDVVHTHNQLPLTYAALPGRASGARVVHTKHGPHPDSLLRMWLRRAGAACTHCFVAVSEPTAAFSLETREVARRKLRVILNGTDVKRFERDPERRRCTRTLWRAAQDAWIIGTVGRMSAEKNHSLLLSAATPLLGPTCLLVVAGDGTERAATERLAEELGIADHVRFLGEVRDVPAVMAGLDAFALSSHFEGLPLVLTEAMSAGLPIVATSVGGVPDVVREGETGYLVPAGDCRAFTEALRRLRNDPMHASKMGERGHEIAQHSYSLDRMTEEYLAAYGV
jgi:glycosyltransferase involved in cell wall biosynthesis